MNKDNENLTIIYSTSKKNEKINSSYTISGDGQALGIVRRKSGGKWIAEIVDINMPTEATKQLAKQLKNKLNVGGTVKNGHIILQGDVRERAAMELKSIGFKTKNIGG